LKQNYKFERQNNKFLCERRERKERGERREERE
jgi:hypothetical protein